MKKFITSPFCFYHSRNFDATLEEVGKQTRINSVNSEVNDVLFSFLNPKSIKQAIEEGHNQHTIEACIDANLIQDAHGEYIESAKLWEDHIWSRPAFLTFSQMNLKYLEDTASLNRSDLVKERREILEKYQSEEDYPRLYLPNEKDVKKIVCLQNSTAIQDLNSLRNRQSVRGFSDSPVSKVKFESILTQATTAAREAERTKVNNDAYFLVNSFYTWAVPFVVIQNVEDYEPGVYHYNVISNKLSLVNDTFTNEDIARLVQGQEWIKGGGFCILIGVQWDRYYWVYRHARAYINLLIQVGELSQEILLSSYSRQLGGWMTPAVNESLANSMCRIDEKNDLDIMFFMKIGPKKNNV